MHPRRCILNIKEKIMNQTLEQLIKLQEIDHRLLEIKEHMGDLPRTVESQELEIASLQSENEQKQERITEIEKNIRHHESEIEDFSTKMTKYKDQLYLVKSNKAYDALSQEIDHMKATISESESVQIQYEEEKTELEENIKLNGNKIESISESLNSNRTELKSAMAETTHEQEELESNRSTIFKKIEPSYLNTYERLRNARDGVGMASIIGQACGGCFSQLPPQTVIEIKENKQIFDLLDYIFQGNAIKALQIYNELYQAGADIIMIFDEMLNAVHFITEIKIAPNLKDDIFIPELERVKGSEISAKLTMATLGLVWQVLFKGYQELQEGLHLHQHGEMIILRLIYLHDGPTPEDLLKEYKGSLSLLSSFRYL